ncbi:MAG TPA: hypothetical protein VEZ14_14550 [Dehalococcoidia bacterium]|nr:hypothetical protein [Dehalococcoidia bacterium]
MPDEPERPAPRRRPPPRLVPRIGDLLDTSEEMIAFVEKYQNVWEAESRAMLAMGEFLGARAEAMRYQAELMRMGTDTFRRYVDWSEALLSLRPDTIIQAFLRPEQGPRRPARGGDAAE